MTSSSSSLPGDQWWPKWVLNMTQTHGSGQPALDTDLGSPSEEEIDEELQRALTCYLMGIGGLVVCCFGMVANGLSVAVLTRRSMRSSTYTYLAALAVCDWLVLVFTALLALKGVPRYEATDYLDHLYTIYFPYVHPTAIVFQVTSIWLTLAFTVDRYIMICHPFRAESLCRRSRARRVVVALYIAGALFCVPKYLEYYTHRHELSVLNATEVVYGIEMTELGKNEVFREVVHSWMYLLCVCGLPFLTLLVLNAFLMHAVRLSRRRGRQLNARDQRRNDTTVMLIGVVVIFLICQGPALVSRMIYAFKPVDDISQFDFTLNEVANFLVILNSAINIVPYYFFGHKFRAQFWALFCCCGCCGCLLDHEEVRRITRSHSMSAPEFGKRWSTASLYYDSNGHQTARRSLSDRDPRLDTPLIRNGEVRGGVGVRYLAPDSYLSTNGHSATGRGEGRTGGRVVQLKVTSRDLCPQTGV